MSLSYYNYYFYYEILFYYTKKILNVYLPYNILHTFTILKKINFRIEIFIYQRILNNLISIKSFVKGKKIIQSNINL